MRNFPSLNRELPASHLVMVHVPEFLSVPVGPYAIIPRILYKPCQSLEVSLHGYTRRTFALSRVAVRLISYCIQFYTHLVFGRYALCDIRILAIYLAFLDGDRTQCLSGN